MIIYFDGWLFIFDYYAHLWVISGVLTIKMFFATNRVVWVLGVDGIKSTKTKNSKFHDLRNIGYYNYGVKIYLAY